MPIYEFYCKDCHTVFNFFSSTVNTEKIPLCPKCNKNILEKVVSLFSVKRGGKEDDETLPLSNIDESKIMKAAEMLEKETRYIKDDDPKAAAGLMKRLLDATGLRPGAGMEEIMHRLEKGEDPEQIEADMGEVSDDDIIEIKSKTKIKSRKMPPFRDEKLYIL